jgi:hypothetical protein
LELVERATDIEAAVGVKEVLDIEAESEQFAEESVFVVDKDMLAAEKEFASGRGFVLVRKSVCHLHSNFSKDTDQLDVKVYEGTSSPASQKSMSPRHITLSLDAKLTLPDTGGFSFDTQSVADSDICTDAHHVSELVSNGVFEEGGFSMTKSVCFLSF